MRRLVAGRVRWWTRAAALAAILLVPGALLAHAHLKKSAPAAGERLAASPHEITLWFTEAPEVAVTSVTLLGPDGTTAVATGAPTRSPETPLAVVVPVSSTLAPGRYVVRWRTAAADGHPSHGEFAFEVRPVAPPAAAAVPEHAAPPTPSSSSTAAPTPARASSTSPPERAEGGANSVGYDIIRWVYFVSLVALIGAAAFNTLVLGLAGGAGGGTADGLDPRLRSGVARAGMIAATVLLVAAGGRLYAQMHAMFGGDGVTTAPPSLGAGPTSQSALGAMLWHTSWGIAWVAQVVLALVALAALAVARRGSRSAWGLATLAVLAIAFTPALSGHAVASPSAELLAIVADGVHVLAAGVWLGSLVMVLAVAIPAVVALERGSRGGALAELVNAFSTTALAAVGVLVVTGTIAAWIHLGTLGALWGSTYGRVLLIKLCVLIPVVALGAYNWRVVRPSLATSDGASRIRRSAGAELAIGLIVIAVTAVLVATPTPGS